MMELPLYSYSLDEEGSEIVKFAALAPLSSEGEAANKELKVAYRKIKIYHLGDSDLD